MNKAKLIDEMAKHTEFSKAVCKKALEAFLETVAKVLKKKTKESVVLTNFGTFSVAHRKARTGVNPATRKQMTIPAQSVPRFKPGKKLRAAVRDKK